ncbi:hypothetical protein IFM46972_04087 [Aspergillus udagawae]|uniref:Uncharacterized protein n=1 Tax=Aspergillus udagawae TaxID=91492 RepID=A0A8H3NH53_9EURO|nr:hypothetical protein IFM46972_04087 [Aspergillus udagawae]
MPMSAPIPPEEGVLAAQGGVDLCKPRLYSEGIRSLVAGSGIDVVLFRGEEDLACVVVWGPQRPGCGIGDIDQKLDGLAPDAKVPRGCRGLPVESDKVHQVQFVGWTPDHGWVVVECAEELLGEGVGSSWAGTRLRADNGAEWPPAGESAASVYLRDDEMEERRVMSVVDDMSAPGGIASAVAVEVRQGDVGMVVAGISVDGLQVELAAVGRAPARVTDALFGY